MKILSEGSALQPVQPGRRIEALDILRGWAIFGVLLVDIGYGPRETWMVSDQFVAQFLLHFADSKFWTLLSFLFGLGFSLQLIRAEGRGAGFIASYSRRLFALLLIAIAQILLLMWGGHFLIIYAVMGFLLLALRTIPSRILLPAAVTLMLIPSAYEAGIDLIREGRLGSPQTRLEVLQGDAERNARRTAVRREGRQAAQQGYLYRVTRSAKGLYRGYILHVYESFSGWLINPPFGFVKWLTPFGLFLVGLYVGRRRILQDIPAHLPLIRRILIWGLVPGLAVAAIRYLAHYPDLSNQSLTTRHLVRMLGIFSDPALAFAYASALVLLAQRQIWQKLFAPLAAAGRMALTNYLLIALLAGVFAPAYGFGVWKQVGPTLSAMLAVAIYAALMLLSTWWLRHFRYGPAEWLWRTLTYSKLQPLRLQVTN